MHKRHMLQIQVQLLNQQIKMIDENMHVTNKYINQEENTMKVNQEHIISLKLKL